MGTKVYIRGRIYDSEDAKVSVFDRGFLYGDSVYEVLRTSGGRLVDYERHVERLIQSGASLALQVPAAETLHSAIHATLNATGNRESYLRIVVTRGEGEVGLDTGLATDSTLVVIAKPLILPPQSAYQNGVGVAVVNVQRTSAAAVDPSVKSGNYLNNILALAEARKSDAHEAIMCDSAGLVAEGASSNIFFVSDGVLTTPSLSVGLLAGITRQRVIELAAKLGMTIAQTRLPAENLRASSEAFLTSSIRGVVPISRVDGVPLGAHTPGPVTGQLMGAYDAFLASYR